ncbi:immunity 49 family protein [Yinghuangia sp. ASG 101]|uniref:immunity 49 family protein n=1 Tax=Yinghuangia sp. ASG 101 TaxID=2896848 RepID=UPI001E58D2C9|nr:immunity 49 family protein [Yinghuangia sp. ASG 101]UGQ14486.1 immunity 49 family protein [Yinghuangia sp. ASG 101]
MVVEVPRHSNPSIADEGYAKALEATLADNIMFMERSPTSGARALNTALTALQARLAINPSGSLLESWEGVVTAMQISSALFASATAPEGETVTCRIAHETRTIPAAGPSHDADGGNWLKAFWLAIVCRDQERMTLLAEVPLDVVRGAEVQYDEYVYHWIDTLQAYWLERPGLAEKLTATIEASYPNVARNTDRELLEKILYQPINMFHKFVRRDHAGFNQALLEALRAHRQFWSADEELADTVAGMLALGPLAITCLAYDAGFPIDVESDYLPKHFLRRSWLGEFET